jgi:hypothetical protein
VSSLSVEFVEDGVLISSLDVEVGQVEFEHRVGIAITGMFVNGVEWN